MADAIDNDRDPAGDPEVQRVLTATQIGNEGVRQHVNTLAYDRFRTVCDNYADQLVTAWRVPLDTAAATLVTAHDRFGTVSLTDTGTIMATGGDVADVWAAAREAVTTIDTITAG